MENVFIKEEKPTIILKQMAFSNAAFLYFYMTLNLEKTSGKNVAKHIESLERPIYIPV